MRILLHTSHPRSATGYSVQTKLLVPRWQALGYEVVIACWYGQQGEPHYWESGEADPVLCLPTGFSQYSQETIPLYFERWECDVVVTTIDPWVYPPEIFRTGGHIPWIPWYPVDGEPLGAPSYHAIKHADKRLPISRYGEQETRQRGLDCTYVPCVYDPTVYHPDGPAADIAPGKYVVGVVAANKGWPPRKAWPQIFEGFSMFRQARTDAVLYVHAFHSPVYGGMDLRMLQRIYGIPDESVIWANTLDV